MGSNLNDHLLNVDCYMQKLYTNLRITIYQKPLTNMQKIRRKKSSYITKENQQTMREIKKGSEKSLRNKHKTNNKMIILIYQ